MIYIVIGVIIVILCIIAILYEEVNDLRNFKKDIAQRLLGKEKQIDTNYQCMVRINDFKSSEKELKTLKKQLALEKLKKLCPEDRISLLEERLF